MLTPDVEDHDVHDIVGVGFGPANLALAVAAREGTGITTAFVERQPTFRWHGGMLLDGATMQSSFLKDVVTLRNPRSAFSYLAYLQAMGRLERFASLSTLYPSRVEFNDYLCWVASQFADDVLYETEVETIDAVLERDAFRVSTIDARGARRDLLGRNVVVGVGGRPRIPRGVGASARIVHSSDFLPGLAEVCPAPTERYELAVVGAGQSAGEIVCHLLEAYREARVHLITRRSTIRRLDDNPFANDHFSTESSNHFYQLSGDEREGELARLTTANHGVMSDELLERLYAQEYESSARGTGRFIIHRGCEIIAAREVGDRVVVDLADRDGSHSTPSYDAVFLGTGYVRSVDSLPFLRRLDARIARDAAGSMAISSAHRLDVSEPLSGGVYLLGHHESRFGLGDSLLAHVALRAGSVVRDVAVHRSPGPALHRAVTAG